MIEVRVVDEAVVAVLECGLGVIDILSPTSRDCDTGLTKAYREHVRGRWVV